MAAKREFRCFVWALAVLLSLGCLGLAAVGPPVLAQEPVYIGSETCGTAGCHLDKYNEFRQSGHPYKLVDSASARTRPIKLPVNVTWDEVTYVIGGYKWKSRYLGTDGYIITRVDTDGDGVLDTDGMNQYNYLTQTFTNYHPGELKPYDCGRCHTTGWVADEDWDFDDDLSDNQDGLPGIHGTFAFGGVQCEACHGPGGHGQPIDSSAAACGACHIRGDSATIPASGGFIRHHEQYNEHLASPHAALDCTTCHDPHKQSATSIRVTCADCHEAQAQAYAGTPMDRFNVTCEDCHMPFASKSAVALGPNKGDVATHLFRIDTSASAKLFTEDGKFVALDGDGKAKVTLDFACLGCHTSESLVWAEFYAKNFHGTNPRPDLERVRRPRFPGGIFH